MDGARAELTDEEENAWGAFQSAYTAGLINSDATGAQPEARVVHAAAVAASRAGRITASLALLRGLLAAVNDVFPGDWRSRHAVLNDVGAMTLESGQRSEAASLLFQALDVVERQNDWEANPDLPNLTLGTMATLLSALNALDRNDEAATITARGEALLAGLADADADARALKFRMAAAIVDLGAGRIGKAEAALDSLERLETEDADFSAQIARISISLGSSRLHRKRYADSVAFYERAIARLRDTPFVQDLADAVGGLAIVYHEVSGNNPKAEAFKEAWRLNTEAIALRETAPRTLASSGCDDLHLRALMMLDKGDLRAAERLEDQALQLARKIWGPDDALTTDVEIGKAGILLARGRPRAALALADHAVEAHAGVADPARRPPLMRALHVRSAIRLSDRDRLGAAADAERYLALEAEVVRTAIAPSWSLAETAATRQAQSPLNAFVNALRPDLDDPAMRARVFGVVAASKDLALRSLREARGAASPRLRASTLPADVAACLPSGSAYLEFYVRHETRRGTARLGWGAPELLAFVVRAESPPQVSVVSLGDYRPVARLLKSLPLASAVERPGFLERLGARLMPRLDPLLGDAGTVFIAPDRLLHAAPFAALTHRSRRWLDYRKVALVESVAAVVGAPIEKSFGGTKGLVISCADPGLGLAYPPLPFAQREADLVAGLMNANNVRLQAQMTGGPEIVKFLIARDAPSLLHIVAHADSFDARGGLRRGWVAPRLEEAVHAGDAYDRSRLILGGFNAWADGTLAATPLDSVSMSANDIATMDLRRTLLVTLSVCHGGRGQDQGLESAASLATAARAAGAGAVVAALNGVPDEATAAFMIAFYQALRHGHDAITALHQAQRSLRDQGGALSAWSGFTLWAGPDALRAGPSGPRGRQEPL